MRKIINTNTGKVYTEKEVELLPGKVIIRNKEYDARFFEIFE